MQALIYIHAIHTRLQLMYAPFQRVRLCTCDSRKYTLMYLLFLQSFVYERGLLPPSN